MIFVISGEGSTDLGFPKLSVDWGDFNPIQFQMGPIAAIIHQRLDRHDIDFDIYGHFVSKSHLIEIGRTRPIRLPREDSDFDTAYFFRNAQALAIYAAALGEGPTSCPVAAILFHDADPTRSNRKNIYKIKLKSIYDGFESAKFPFGVAMLANPISEAWLLCAAKENPYQHCQILEETSSGNGDASVSAKDLLTAALKGESAHVLTDQILQKQILTDNISMKSFDHFKKRLDSVVLAMQGKTVSTIRGDIP